MSYDDRKYFKQIVSDSEMYQNIEKFLKIFNSSHKSCTCTSNGTYKHKWVKPVTQSSFQHERTAAGATLSTVTQI